MQLMRTLEAHHNIPADDQIKLTINAYGFLLALLSLLGHQQIIDGIEHETGMAHMKSLASNLAHVSIIELMESFVTDAPQKTLAFKDRLIDFCTALLSAWETIPNPYLSTTDLKTLKSDRTPDSISNLLTQEPPSITTRFLSINNNIKQSLALWFALPPKKENFGTLLALSIFLRELNRIVALSSQSDPITTLWNNSLKQFVTFYRHPIIEATTHTEEQIIDRLQELKFTT